MMARCPPNARIAAASVITEWGEMKRLSDSASSHRWSEACIPSPNGELHQHQLLNSLGLVDSICLTQPSYVWARPDWTEPTESSKASLFVDGIFSAFVLL